MINDISIIIPFFNGEQFYSTLLNSILKAIRQCNNLSLNFEIITIIDSEETDSGIVQHQTNSIFGEISNVDIKLKKNQNNIGVAASRNVGLDMASGDYIHIIDQDDTVTEHFYSETLSLVKSYNFILTNGLVNYSEKRYNSHKLYYFSPNLSLKGLLKDDYIRSPGQVVFSRELLGNTRFPEPKNYKGADDRFFWLALFVGNALIIRPFYLFKPLYIASIHNDNYSADQWNLRKSSLENWEIFNSKFDTSAFASLINADINSLKFSANEKLNFFEMISGCYYRVSYFFNLNKVLRFFLKRVKF